MSEFEPNDIFSAVKSGLRDMLIDVINSGIDVNYQDENCFSPLMLAAMLGNTEMINLLLDCGADIELKTQQYTPLMLASEQGRLHVVECLLNRGANINASSDEGVTPLMLAVRDNNIDVVELLVKEDADLNKRTINGSTALAVAKQFNQVEIIEFLEKHLGIYDYGIQPELMASLSKICINEDFTKDRIDMIRNNIFPPAWASITNAENIKWHKYAHLPNSSQALAVDVFGTLSLSKFRDDIINEVCKMTGVKTGTDWKIEFEYEPPKPILNEPTPTSVDVKLESENSVLIIECKFTEHDGGSCSQTNKMTYGKFKGQPQCSGNYEEQTNPVNNKTSKCALSGKGINYWDYIPNIYSIDTTVDYKPCPFDDGSYQFMRNLCIVDSMKKTKDSKFIISFVEGEDFSISRMIKNNTIFKRYLPKAEYYAFISFQEIIDIAMKISKKDTEEHKTWLSLKSHFESKLNSLTSK